jgi:hypothetical protein
MLPSRRVTCPDYGTIPYSMQGCKAGCYRRGICDRVNSPGSGSRLFYIKTWAMIWPTDYRDCDYHLEPRADTAQEPEQADSGSGVALSRANPARNNESSFKIICLCAESARPGGRGARQSRCGAV